MEYLDIVDENGIPTGKVISRDEAHKEGIMHRTAHVWITRRIDGRSEVLLQKRSMNKESFPGMYDTSSAGHIPAGAEPLPSALRELSEELGIQATPEQLRYIGTFHIQYEMMFHGKLFKDNEITSVFLYSESVDTDKLVLQGSEVESVEWFDIDEVWDEIQHSRERFCVPAEGLSLIRTYLQRINKEDTL